MKEYSSYLTFKGLDSKSLEKIKSTSVEFKLEIELGSNFLEFEYSGNDISRNVIKFFYNLARIVGNAKGELICEIINDSGDNKFEFYNIENGELICQRGEIIRGNREIVKI
jgi:hypothetical protein